MGVPFGRAGSVALISWVVWGVAVFDQRCEIPSGIGYAYIELRVVDDDDAIESWTIDHDQMTCDAFDSCTIDSDFTSLVHGDYDEVKGDAFNGFDLFQSSSGRDAEQAGPA